jgi:hypothetical protein
LQRSEPDGRYGNAVDKRRQGEYSAEVHAAGDATARPDAKYAVSVEAGRKAYLSLGRAHSFDF